MKKVVAAVALVLVAVALLQVLFKPDSTRAVYLQLPAVEGVNQSCTFTDMTDLVQAGVILDSLQNFSAQELVSLECSGSNRQYSVMIYLDVSPFDRRTIEDSLPAPDHTVGNRSVYSVGDNSYFVPVSSTFYFYSFKNISEPLAVINNSLNYVDPYPVEPFLGMLDRIPDSADTVDSEVRQIRAEFNDVRKAIKEWYVGTTRLASTTAYVILREPKDADLVLGCADGNSTYTNSTAASGTFYVCSSGNKCGPKYLVMEDSVAYTQVPMDCSSVEDVFTTEILQEIR